MTVAELIEYLEGFAGRTPVVIEDRRVEGMFYETEREDRAFNGFPFIVLSTGNRRDVHDGYELT